MNLTKQEFAFISSRISSMHVFIHAVQPLRNPVAVIIQNFAMGYVIEVIPMTVGSFVLFAVLRTIAIFIVLC
ncbi:MAG: hypothetical protein ACOX5R_06355 [bacterium]|jgi:hypothetical protein